MPFIFVLEKAYGWSCSFDNKGSSFFSLWAENWISSISFSSSVLINGFSEKKNCRRRIFFHCRIHKLHSFFSYSWIISFFASETDWRKQVWKIRLVIIRFPLFVLMSRHFVSCLGLSTEHGRGREPWVVFLPSLFFRSVYLRNPFSGNRCQIDRARPTQWTRALPRSLGQYLP